MRQHNDGQGEVNALQNRFTAYLLVAVKRQKRDYIQKRNQVKNSEVPITPEMEETIDCGMDGDPMEYLSPIDQIEDIALLGALNRLTARERYVLFERLLNESEYGAIGGMLGLRYGGVAAIYRRTIKKLRKELGDDIR